jgi:uncharacterized membrane protein YtjA (UPF0391 family)
VSPDAISLALCFRFPSATGTHVAVRTILSLDTGANPVAGGEKVKEIIMLYYAALFFVIALVAALFGFGGIAAGAVEIAKILFFIFLVLFVVSLIVGLVRRGPRV